MNNLFLVAKLRLDQKLNISRRKYEKDKGRKRLYLLHSICRGCLVIAAVFLIYLCADAFAGQGGQDALPVLSYVIGSGLSLVIMVLKINEQLSGNTDVEFLLSLPISNVIQIFLMFLQLYIETTAWVLLFAVPMGAAYGQHVSVSADFWVRWCLGVLMTSLPVSGIASLLGIVMALLLSSRKNRNFIQNVISIGVISAVLMLGLHIVYLVGNVLSQQGMEESGAISQQMIAVISQNYKLGYFYQMGIVEGNAAWMALFMLISAIWNLFFVFFLSMGYQEFLLAIKAPVSYGEYVWKDLEMRDIKKTVFAREIDLWLRSKSYMLHSVTGAAAAVISSFWVFWHGKAELCRIFHCEDMIQKIIWSMPAFLCACIGLCCTTYCSLSIEGKRHWIWATAPVEDRVLYGAKIRLNLWITLPLAFLCGSLLSIGLQASVLQTACSLLIPAAYSAAGAYWGMLVEKKYADYSGESESQVLSQSISFFLGKGVQTVIPVLAGMLLLL